MTIARRGRNKKEYFTSVDLMSVNPSVVIGIDPGTNTGITVYDCEKKEYIACDTMLITNAIFLVEKIISQRSPVLITVEDSRSISGDASKKLGAGSIRRDCSIWEDYLNEKSSIASNGVFYRFVKPTKNPYLKIPILQWMTISKYKGSKRPSEHARDSATYIFKYL
jgi:hypothetical protein